MIRYIRAVNSSAVDFIQPHLLPDDDVPVEAYVDFLKAALKLRPDSILILLALDDEAEIEKSLKGFLIGIAPQTVSYVHVTQVNLLENIPKAHIADQLYLRLTTWANNIGRRYMQMETTRDPAGWTRRFGFRVKTTTMIKEIDESFDAQVALRIQQLTEVNHEQGRPEDSQQSDEGSAGGGESGGGVPSTGSVGGEVQPASTGSPEGVEDRAGSDAVQWNVSVPPPPGVQPGQEPSLPELAEQIRQRKSVGGT